MKLSIVATLYMSAPYIQEFYERSRCVAQEFAGDDFEIVLVNDGSPDNSLDVAKALVARDAHVSVVDLSRNFGHHKAILTGLAHARGEYIYLLDSDLEEEPEWLLPFAEQLRQEESDVVYGVQESRKGNRFERWTGAAYYGVFNFMCNMKFPRNITTARLMTKRYVAALLLHREREVIFGGLCVLTGFKQQAIFVKKHATSPTTYSLWKKIKMLLDSIVSFSTFPLELIFYIGVSISSMALLSVCYFITMKIFFSHVLDGWTSIVVSIWLLGGLIISFIGVIGIYIAKVFSEVKQRPLTIIRNIYGHSVSSTEFQQECLGEATKRGEQ